MVSAVIVAAGRGSRMGGPTDKVFLEVAGRPIISHTWQRFDDSSLIDEIVFVVRDEARELFRSIARSQGFQKPYKLVEGGGQRQDSVWNGVLGCDPQSDIIAIHDGARPCVTEKILSDTIGSALRTGAAVTGSRIVDTIKTVSADGLLVDHLDRDLLRAVQTPQVFKAQLIREALQKASEEGVQYTDDTAAVQALGHSVTVVETSEPNPKATVPSDLALIERRLATMRNS